MGTVIIAISVMVVGIILFFTFKPKPKVAFTEEHLPIESLKNSEEAAITEKPVVRRVYKKREISGETRSKKVITEQ